MNSEVNIFMILAFLFFVGSLAGWVLEVFYRRFFSAANPNRKWINPGFLTGPYLPLYGFSLCALYLLAHIKVGYIQDEFWRKIVLFILMAIVVTIIEFIAGLIFIRRMKIKLWDYDNQWGNIMGIICPKYTFFWAILSAIYYFLIHPYMLSGIVWLERNLQFSFILGFFYGVFVLDVWYSMNMLSRIKKFADNNGIVVRYEYLKASIRAKSDELKEKSSFVFAFASNTVSLAENLKIYLEKEQERFEKMKENIKKSGTYK